MDNIHIKSQSVSEEKVIFQWETDQHSDKVFNASSLSGKRVDNWALGFWSLGQVTKETHYTFETSPVIFVSLEGDSSHEFAENNEINDDSGSKQTILADIVAHEGMFSAHEDLA